MILFPLLGNIVIGSDKPRLSGEAKRQYRDSIDGQFGT